MFIREIRVKNYQSLYDVNLQLGNFTVVYGNSDVGKSALYRAIRGLVTCEEGDTFISKGKVSTGVSLVLSDYSGEEPYYNKTVVWLKRRSKSSEYYMECDSSPYGKQVGDNVHMSKDWKRCRKLPQMLEDVLGVRGILIDGEWFYPNFRGQFERPFFLFESSSKKARMLGVLVSNILLYAIKLANVKRNRNEANIRALEDLVEGFEQRLTFDWDAVSKEIKKLVVVNNKILKEIEKFDKVHELMYKRRMLRNEVAQVEGLEELQTVVRDSLLFYGKNKILLQAIVEAQACRERLKEQIKAAKVDLSLPVSFDELDKQVNLLFKITDLQLAYSKIQKVEKLSLVLVYRKELKELEKKIKRMEKELKITCPYCKKEFSIDS